METSPGVCVSQKRERTLRGLDNTKQHMVYISNFASIQNIIEMFAMVFWIFIGAVEHFICELSAHVTLLLLLVLNKIVIRFNLT